MNDDIAYVYELFPILGERRKQPAGTLSGGEQQMLAIGRALVGRPELLLLDEPSMGLAPLVVERIFEALAKLNKGGLTMLMVEQSAEMALSLAHRGVVLQTGCVVVSGLAEELKSDDRVRASYLGAALASDARFQVREQGHGSYDDKESKEEGTNEEIATSWRVSLSFCWSSLSRLSACGS